MTFYSNAEGILKKVHEAGLEQALFYFGLEINLYRPLKNDVYSQVHNRNAGTTTQLIKTFIGILQSDDFFPSNSQYAGGFEAGFLYTKEPDILVGDTISVKPKDSKVRRYNIDKKESIGNSQEVFLRYTLTAIGD